MSVSIFLFSPSTDTSQTVNIEFFNASYSVTTPMFGTDAPVSVNPEGGGAWATQGILTAFLISHPGGYGNGVQTQEQV